MGFSFKVAPGVRIRASSRGIRTSVGPRAARVHVGAGSTGVSSGAGPVSFYTSLGGGRRGSGRSRSRPPSMASYQRQLAAAEKAEEAQRLAHALQEILNVHRTEFPPAVAPVAPPPSLPDAGTVRRRHEREALAGIGLFQRAARADAKERATRAAEAELAAARQQAVQQQAEFQRQLDQWWHQLCQNNPDVVLATLAEAFEDNEAPAAPVAVDGAELDLVVLAPPYDVVPERMPDRTQAGNLTLRKLPKGERSALYGLLVFGHLLVTMREAFAVAPASRRSVRYCSATRVQTRTAGRGWSVFLLAGFCALPLTAYVGATPTRAELLRTPRPSCWSTFVGARSYNPST
jgi:hypothetical protein